MTRSGLLSSLTSLATRFATQKTHTSTHRATGALPVCALCYLLPAYLDVKVRRAAAAAAAVSVRVEDGGEGATTPLLPRPRADSSPTRPPSLAAPLAVAALGLVSSGAAAWYSVKALAASWGWAH